MKKSKSMNLVLGFIVAMIIPFFVASMANAYQITTTLDGLPVNATANFAIDDAADEITVTINNLIVNPTGVIQNLSGLGFALNIADSPVPILASSSAYYRNVASDGSYTQGGPADTGWELQSGVALPFGTGFLLNVLGTQPNPADRTLIGQPDGLDIYSNANGSIAANIPHNPFIYGPATFVIDFTGIYDLQPGTNISGVEWRFGTGPTTAVPEPATMLLLGCGLIGLAGFGRKKLFR